MSNFTEKIFWLLLMLDYTYSKANFIFHRTVVSVKPILYLLLLRKKTCIGKTNFCGKKIFETERRRKEEGGRRTLKNLNF